MGKSYLSKQGSVSALVARLSRGRSAVALADQILVSGSNFLTSIVLVRGLGLSEFGKFGIAYVLLLYANAVQMSLITSPMLTLGSLMFGDEKKRFVEGMLAGQVLTSLLLFIVFGLAGAVLRIVTPFYSLPCILVFAGCIGTFQLQDWLRRYYFLCNKGKLGIVSDFISYFVQLGLLFTLWRANRLTLFGTFLVMCITSVSAVVMGPITDRLRPAVGRLRETWAISRSLSRDLLVANQVRWFGIQGVFLIGTWIVGTAAAGGLRATQNFAGPVNLVLTSIENVVPIRIAEELKSKGTAGAYQYMRYAILGGTLFFGLLFIPLGIFGRSILRFLYGPALVAFYVPMLLQLLCIVVQISANLWYHLFRGLRDTSALLRANAVSAFTSVATVYLFGHRWSVSGIVLSSLAGQVSIVAYYMLYWARHRQELLLRHPPQTSLRSGAATVA